MKKKYILLLLLGFFGMNISDTPLHVITSSFSAGAYLMVIAALLVPIISYLTQVLNIKLMPQATASGNDQSDGTADEDDEPYDAVILTGYVFYCSGRSWYLLDCRCCCPCCTAVFPEQAFREDES